MPKLTKKKIPKKYHKIIIGGENSLIAYIRALWQKVSDQYERLFKFFNIFYTQADINGATEDVIAPCESEFIKDWLSYNLKDDLIKLTLKNEEEIKTIVEKNKNTLSEKLCCYIITRINKKQLDSCHKSLITLKSKIDKYYLKHAGMFPFVSLTDQLTNKRIVKHARYDITIISNTFDPDNQYFKEISYNFTSVFPKFTSICFLFVEQFYFNYINFNNSSINADSKKINSEEPENTEYEVESIRI